MRLRAEGVDLILAIGCMSPTPFARLLWVTNCTLFQALFEVLQLSLAGASAVSHIHYAALTYTAFWRAPRLRCPSYIRSIFIGPFVISRCLAGILICRHAVPALNAKISPRSCYNVMRIVSRPMPEGEAKEKGLQGSDVSVK
jgi:hypothetical protein